MATTRTKSVRKKAAPVARKAVSTAARAAQATTKVRPKPKPKPKTKTKTKAGATRKSSAKTARAEKDRSLDRYIERWARRLLFADKGVVRRLTEDEVQVMVGKKATKSRRRA